MAEEISIIHGYTTFFDECIEYIPESVYFPEIEKLDQHKRINYKRNADAKRIMEIKENAQKRRREKFNPENDSTMVEKIAERKKKMDEEAEAEIATVVPLVKTERAKNLDELRERLHKKIEMFAKNRIEKENKKKQKQNQKKGNKKQKQTKETAAAAQTTEESASTQEATDASKQDKEPAQQSTAPTITDVISNIQFGKVKGTAEVDTSLRPKARKDIHKLLKQAQKKQEYLKKLKSTEEGKKEAENLEWNAALSKAEGFRKKDNPSQLKKTIKRQEARKKKSKEEWRNRKYAEKKNKEKKETKNRPGFEGKKKGFLNGKGKGKGKGKGDNNES